MATVLTATSANNFKYTPKRLTKGTTDVKGMFVRKDNSHTAYQVYPPIRTVELSNFKTIQVNSTSSNQTIAISIDNYTTTISELNCRVINNKLYVTHASCRLGPLTFRWSTNYSSSFTFNRNIYVVFKVILDGHQVSMTEYPWDSVYINNQIILNTVIYIPSGTTISGTSSASYYTAQYVLPHWATNYPNYTSVIYAEENDDLYGNGGIYIQDTWNVSDGYYSSNPSGLAIVNGHLGIYTSLNGVNHFFGNYRDELFVNNITNSPSSIISYNNVDYIANTYPPTSSSSTNAIICDVTLPSTYFQFQDNTWFLNRIFSPYAYSSKNVFYISSSSTYNLSLGIYGGNSSSYYPTQSDSNNVSYIFNTGGTNNKMYIGQGSLPYFSQDTNYHYSYNAQLTVGPEFTYGGQCKYSPKISISEISYNYYNTSNIYQRDNYDVIRYRYMFDSNSFAQQIRDVSIYDYQYRIQGSSTTTLQYNYSSTGINSNSNQQSFYNNNSGNGGTLNVFVSNQPSITVYKRTKTNDDDWSTSNRGTVDSSPIGTCSSTNRAVYYTHDFGAAHWGRNASGERSVVSGETNTLGNRYNQADAFLSISNNNSIIRVTLDSTWWTHANISYQTFRYIELRISDKTVMIGSLEDKHFGWYCTNNTPYSSNFYTSNTLGITSLPLSSSSSSMTLYIYAFWNAPGGGGPHDYRRAQFILVYLGSITLVTEPHCYRYRLY